MKPLLILLLLLATTPAYGARGRWRPFQRARPATITRSIPVPRITGESHIGRVCTSGTCGMCNRLHMAAGHDLTTPDLSYAAFTEQHDVLHPAAPEWLAAPISPPDELPFVPTPTLVVDAMLAAVRPTTRDVLYDLGCGDGRILIAAVRDYGCRAVGIEINAETAELARANVRAAGLEGKIAIRTGDALKFNLDGATIVTMYLSLDTMDQLVPYITNATRIVSYSHPIPGRVNERFTVGEDHPVYVWRAK